MSRAVFSSSLTALALAVSATAQAADVGSLEQRLNEQEARLRQLESQQMAGGNASDVKVSGFVNFGAHTTNVEEGVTYGSSGMADDDITFAGLTSAGIQIEGKVTDTVSGTVQLLAEGVESYDVNAEWAYLSYAFTPDVKVRAGRMVLPLFMHSQYINVGYAYPWIKPPAESYDSVGVRTMEGVDFLYQFTTGDVAHTFNTYYGAIDVEADFGGVPVVYSVRESVGVNLASQWGNLSTWAAYSSSQISLDLPDLSAAPVPPPANQDFSTQSLDGARAYFASFGVQYDNGSLLLMGERTRLAIHSDWFPTNDAAYVLAGYRFGRYLPHVTWATVDDKGFTEASGAVESTLLYLDSARHQKSWTFGVRADVAPNLAVKAEVSHYYDLGDPEQPGSSGFFSAPPEEDHPMVYRMAVNLVF